MCWMLEKWQCTHRQLGILQMANNMISDHDTAQSKNWSSMTLCKYMLTCVVANAVENPTNQMRIYPREADLINVEILIEVCTGGTAGAY